MNDYQPVDTSIAHPARVYDYLLGGKDNWPVDRAVAEQMTQAIPYLGDEMLANRAFLRRAVRYAAQQGVTQFLDIGTGIPTAGPTHEIAHSVDPTARVVYVDNDTSVLTHARALLVDDDRTYAIQADARKPDSIMNHPQTRRRLDFDRPIAVMFVFLLHFLTDEELDGLIDRYTRYLAPGSRLIISHGLDSPAGRAAAEPYRATAPLVPRTRAAISDLFAGWDLAAPGLVPIHQWRPDPGDPAPKSRHAVGGVGIKP
jgi:hypothetical protein